MDDDVPGSIDDDQSPGADRVSGVDQTPVIDEAALAMLRSPEYGGDPEFLADLIGVFFADTPPRLDAIDAAVVAGNAVDLASAAHSLKGSAGNLGVRRMQALCAEIEALGRRDSTDGAAPLAAQLRQEYATAVTALSPFQSPDQPSTA